MNLNEAEVALLEAKNNYLNAKEITLKYVENIQNHINGVLYEISRLKRTLEDFEAYLKEREDEDASEAGTTIPRGSPLTKT